ncbi:hypothetical protein ACQ4PT_003280 [Festuca glaucescens]
MPLFMSDEELRLLGGDVAAVAERADAAIRELRNQVDTVRAEADAAAIAAEQTCALLEQRFTALSAEVERYQAEAAERAAASERRDADLASSHAEIHQLRIQAIAKDGEVERLKVEISELHKSKCQSLELIEQRDIEIREKDGVIQSYHDKILNQADSSASKEARIQEAEAKLIHCQATCNRIAQEKELIEKHNLWLDEELKAKVKNLADLRKANMDEESRMSAKIAEELFAAKDASAANEQRLGAELSTVMKLAELHKESSDEWSKKAGELEGVIKALETHLTQVEDDYKEKLEKEALAKIDFENEVASLKQKIEKSEFDLENARKSGELSLVPLTSIASDLADLSDTPMKEMTLSNAANQNDLMIVPRVPSGVSGTALAASLLRDGWSVLHEIEEKAELILDERAEHERMVEAYALMDHKLQQALLEHDNFENTIRNLKVTVLLKECQDIQLRCGSSLPNVVDGAFSMTRRDGMSNDESNSHEHMTFNDINGLVQQNVELRSKVHMLCTDLNKKDIELRENFQVELKSITDTAASRVEKVMKKSEEQAIMIESLHRSVAMYRKLCEEQQKTRSTVEHISNNLQDDGRKDLMVLFEGSQEISKKTYEQVSERARKLDEELTMSRTELGSLRSERDKAVLEADFARDRLNGYMAEVDHQRKEANSVSLRNAELMHLVVDYEKRLRESADSMQAVEENSRKLLMEATIDTIHTTDEVQENARSMERRNQQEYIKRLERDWAELKKEVQEQRNHVRVLTLDKKSAFDGCMKQVEDMRKELQSSWKASTDAASRAAVAEAKCSDLEAKLKSKTIILRDGGHDNSSATQVNDELFRQKEELEKYKEEAQANKSYMLQYKEIASSNEAALKQMESAYQDYKTESEIAKRSLEDEIANLRNKLSEMEKSYVMKCEEAASAIEAKEKDITTLTNDIAILRNELTQKLARIENLEIELASSKSALDEQCKRWRSTQDNYERQNALRTSGEQEKIELVKQKDEALRKYDELNDQLESALKSSKDAQDLLRSQADSARSSMFKDEEFKSLQLQVREINLLRESNIQLREENRHNFEECQKFREEVHKAKMEAERLDKILLEKQADADICRKELEMQKTEIANLNQRISELVENSRGVDLNTYETMKVELQNVKSTLRGNSIELEHAKNILSEKEVVIKKLEEKLAGCQSELGARERKLNDVEASLKSEIDKYKKLCTSTRKKLDMSTREKDDSNKGNKILLKQIEDLKSSQKTISETTNDQAVKDYRIQEKKQIEESMEKHKQAVKEAIEHFSGQSFQIPSGSAVEQHFRSYFLAANKLEESPNPFQDGSTSQTPLIETPTVDAPPAARQVATPPRPPTQVKVVEEKAVSTLTKPSKGRRPLVRPPLEQRVEEPPVDTDTPIVEGSTLQEKGGVALERGSAVVKEKGGAPMERGSTVGQEKGGSSTSGGVSVLPSSRKRLMSSSQVRDDVSQGEATDANPPSKKHKEELSQGTSEMKNDQSAPEDVTAQAPVVSVDNQDGQQLTEEMDMDQTSIRIEEVEETRDDDVSRNDDMEEQTGASVDVKSQDTEVDVDNNAADVEDVPVKSEAVVELFDEDQKLEGGKEEGQIATATDGEDEREEGELPEESEQQSDSSPVRVDADMSEETGEGEATPERAVVEPDQSPLSQSGGANASPSRSPAREPSPSNPSQAGASSEQQNPGAVAETGSKGRMVSLTRALQSRQAKFGRIAPPPPSSGRSGGRAARGRKRGGSGGQSQ